MAHQLAGTYPSFSSMKRLGVYLLPLDGTLANRIKFAGTHSNTRVGRGTIGVSCAGTQCARPGIEPGMLEPETSKLTTRPFFHLQHVKHCERGILVAVWSGRPW